MEENAFPWIVEVVENAMDSAKRINSNRSKSKINIIMNKGTVKFYNDTKGFGFIKEEKTEKEYYVHSSGIKENISENDKVTFDLEEGKKGLNAVNVKLV